MIGLSLSFVSKHNMWSYYDWVVVVVFRQQTKYVVVLWLGCRCLPYDNPIIIRLHILFADRRQQQQPNHNTTTYCVYWRKTTNMSSYYDCVLVVVFRQQTQYVVVLWLGFRCLPSVNTICGRIMIGLSLLSSVYDHILCLLSEDNNENTIIIRRHIVLTDGRQRQPNHNTTTYFVCWRKTTTTTQSLWLGFCCYRPSVNTICGRIMIGLSFSSVIKHNTWSYYDWDVVVVVRQ
jgi:hypothetical protein